MRKIKDVLRLKLQAGLSHERIAACLNISKGVVAKYASLAAAAGLDWLAVERLSETALERHLVGGRADRPSQYAQPNFGRIHQELRRKGMTLMLLWEEYAAQHPEQSTWRYSQFCENYRRVSLAGQGDAQPNRIICIAQPQTASERLKLGCHGARKHLLQAKPAGRIAQQGQLTGPEDPHALIGLQRLRRLRPGANAQEK
jgi:hypothetical protein